MTEPAIELRGISKSYDSRQVLSGLDLLVPKGSVLGLLGTNGAGKTTLVKCALGLIRPQAGYARLLGEDAWTLSAQAKIDRVRGLRRCGRGHDFLADTVADRLVESIPSRRLAGPGQLGRHG
jgi:ABC-type transporter Mla maintaining outer membrane lipid asymmetry ATPase subunit MlaF